MAASLSNPQEIDFIQNEIGRFHRGDLTRDELRFRRLLQGTYGQRGQEEEHGHMFRIKLPQGGTVTPEQWETMADLAEKFGHAKVHITTRQNVQLHFVQLDAAPEVMRRLAAVGLTSREACGNTVRNVTCDPMAGICPDEPFDPWPYARAVTRHFLRRKLNEDLPRKFKIAFSCCEDDRGMSGMHDIGAIPVVRKQNGRAERGFRVYVGGGLATHPKKAALLTDFAPAEKTLAVWEAIVAAYQFNFDKHLDRRNRNRARIKFLVEKIGIEAFRKAWQREYDKIKDLPDRQLTELEEPEERPKPLDAPPVDDEQQARRTSRSPDELTEGDGERRRPTSYERWRRTNVVPQKQPGYVAVTVRTILGDLTPNQTRALAAILRKHGVYSRTTVFQNVLLRWVREKDLNALYADLFAAGLAMPGAERVADVTVCPGADTCNLAITASKGIGRVVTEMLSSPEFDDLPPVTVKVSGCFNSCGQHHIANIGIYGASRNIDGREVPHYMLCLGGDAGHGPVEYGKLVIRIPAKRTPDAIRALLNLYRQKRKNGESFNQFIARYDREGMSGKSNPHPTVKQFLEPFTEVPKFSENPDFYTDFGALTTFTTDDIGAGECAGAPMDSGPEAKVVQPAAKRPEKVNNPNYPGGS